MKPHLTQHQKEVFEDIISDIKQNLTSPFRGNIEDHFISLSGPAGTGKSFLTAQIIKTINSELRNQTIYQNDGICITAPTHKAVKVVKDMMDTHNVKASCKTIHSFLSIKPFFDKDTGEEKFKPLRIKRKPPKASLLIVDESSMVSNDLYEFIIEAFNTGRVHTVLFIGDPYQLLPVNSSENPIYKLGKQHHLKEIVRQAEDSPIITLATEIRTRIENQDFINLKEIFKDCESQDIKFFHSKEDFIKDFYKNSHWQNEDKIITSYTNKNVESFNKLIRNKHWEEQNISNPPHLLSQDKIRFKDTFSNEKLHNPIIFQNGEELIIESAKLVKHTNSEIKHWECTAVGRKESQIFRVIDPDYENAFNEQLNSLVHLAKTSEFPKNRLYWSRFYKLKNTFANIQYIYASTIHKLQGSTYDTAYIDLSTLINNNQISNDMKYRLAYVGITRARKDVKIFY